MLSGLQETLRKEVDELKSLLKDAASDMVANSLLNPKAQRLVALLQQLRADAVNRKHFETSFGTTSQEVFRQFENLQRLLSVGAVSVANDVVGQLCEQMENGQWDLLGKGVAGDGGGDSTDPAEPSPKPTSEMLLGLFKELDAICAFVAEHLTSAEGEERRRYAVAAQAFDRGMQHCPLPVPEPVLDANGACKGEVVVVDARADDVISMFKVTRTRASPDLVIHTLSY